MDIDHDRMLKSHDLYKDKLCPQCLEGLKAACEPFRDKNVRKGFRTYTSYLKAIAKWQRSLCEDCYKAIYSESKIHEDEGKLSAMAKKFHDRK